MGITGLNRIIKRIAKDSIYLCDIKEFKNSIIAIDGEILLHRFKSENVNSHIYGFINNVMWYLKNKITPVYVFDGCPNKTKLKNVIVKRSEYKNNLKEKMEEIESQIEKYILETENNGASQKLSPECNKLYDNLNKIKKKISCMSLDKSYRNQCKYLLKLLGIPYIMAAEDAEAFCVVLQRRGIVDYIYTEDTDIVPYYIASLINEDNHDNPIKIIKTTNYSKTPFQCADNNIVEVLDINTLIKQLKMSKESIIDMCILSGCDFCQGITKMTDEKAYELIMKYETIENVITSCKTFNYSNFKYKEAREVFYKNYDHGVYEKIKIEKVEAEKLNKYLSEERHIDKIIVNNIINSFKKIHSL